MTIRIAGREIGAGHPVYIVAELSANHHQRLEEALALVQAAHHAGADAVKLQTYTPDTLTLDSDAAPFRVGAGTIWAGQTLYDLYKGACTPWEWHAQLAAAAHDHGLAWFSSPFDETAVDFLEGLDVPAYKIASFELVDLALVSRVGATGKPIILSTGMATLGEIDDAVRAARIAGAADIALLKCTSAYPAPADSMNLATIPHLRTAFDLPVGLSDHSLGIAVPVAAVTLGACIIEKHLTLSRATPGPDSAFSLEPAEFKAMVDNVRVAERAVGSVVYGATSSEEPGLAFRRSLFVVRDLKAGDVLTAHNVRSIRPGHGLPPKYLLGVLGRPAACDIVKGTPLAWELVG